MKPTSPRTSGSWRAAVAADPSAGGPLGPLHAALLYATAGWAVLPLHTPTPAGCSCRHADCRSAGKHPRIRGGAHAATTELERVEQYWRRWPQANVGIATGRLVVLDIDAAAAETALAALERTHTPLPVTTTVLTGRGRHLYVQAGDHAIGNGALGPGLHIRGHGGYSVAPPSRHASGHTYRWSRTAPLAPIPDWLAAVMQRPDPPPTPSTPELTLAGDRASRYLQRALDEELRHVATAPHGHRNITLNRSAFRLGQLAGAGLATSDELREPLLGAANTAGLPHGEALATIDSGLAAGQRQPRRIAASKR